MANYVRIPLVTEPSDVRDQMIRDLLTRIADWQPALGSLDTALLEIQALQNATILETASSVTDSIYRYLGATLFGIPPEDATFAVADSTWTLTAEATALGATIPAGTEVKIDVTASDSIGFEVLEDVTVAPGDGTTAPGEVQLVALVEGAQGSGLTGPLAEVTPLDFVASRTIDGVSQGGRDAEDDPTYMDRLTRRLRRLTFGLVLPEDVAEAARDIPGIARALVVDTYIAEVTATNERQSITVTGATTGSLYIDYDGETTDPMGAVGGVASTVQDALENLLAIAPGDVIVTGGPLNTAPIIVEFAGSLAVTDVPPMTQGSGGLPTTDGTVTFETITEAVAGSAGVPNSRGALTVIPIDELGEPVGSGVRSALLADLAASVEQGFRFTVEDPVYTDVDVAFAFTIYAGSDPAVVTAAAEARVADYLSPATWGLPVGGDVALWLPKIKVRFGELYAVINATEGLDEVDVLLIDGVANTDLTLDGTIARLPRPGVITGTAL